MAGDVNYHRILVYYIRGVLECEGVQFHPASGLTNEEEAAWCRACLEAGLNEYGQKQMRERIAELVGGTEE